MVIAAALVISPARSATPTSPYVLIIAKDAVLYAPDGTRFYVPAGTEIEMCSDSEPEPRLMYYQIDAHAMVIPEPCAERPLFADGFES